MNEIDLLRMLIGRNKIKVDQLMVEILQKWPRPRSVTATSSFMGLFPLFRHFIPMYPKVVAIFNNNAKKASGVHNWDNERDKLFERIKTASTETLIFIAPG